MLNGLKTEYYVRFASEKYGVGFFEKPAQDLREAAGQFSEDEDSISAMKIVFDENHRMISAEDVTGEVINILKSLIVDDTYTTCPHPIVEDFFNSHPRYYTSYG